MEDWAPWILTRSRPCSAWLERRKGGETGVKSVQFLQGDDVWAAGQAGRWSKELLSSALSRSDTPMGLTMLDGRNQDLVGDGVLPQLVKDPSLFYCIEYTDGTKGTLLMLNGAIHDFNISARLAGRRWSRHSSSCLHCERDIFGVPGSKIEQLYEERKAPYPVQRTLLTTGLLEAFLNSRHRLNQKLETPHLAVNYQPPTESQYARS